MKREKVGRGQESVHMRVLASVCVCMCVCVRVGGRGRCAGKKGKEDEEE